MIMRYNEIITEAASHGFYDPSAIWLHGGPMNLEGGALKRYGKSHQDAGALFFCKDVAVGRWYTATYAGTRGKIWQASLSAPVNSILDITKAKHRAILQKTIAREEFQAIMASRGTSGHMDWAHVDEEMLEPMGFRGAVFQERPKGMSTGLPPIYHMETLPEAVLSVGLFHASDIHLIGAINPEDIWKQMLGTSDPIHESIADLHCDPIYEHDCPRCVFCGQTAFRDKNVVDVYACDPSRKDNMTIVVRYSDEPSEYSSTDYQSAQRNPAYADALKLIDQKLNSADC
jgi:hypothetical protein